MQNPRTVVIPFGVPQEGRGLGLGLAALVHAFIHVEGEGVAIAQLHSKQPDGRGGGALSPVEAFVPPNAWRDIAKRGDGPSDVGLVLTGSFEPPVDGSGVFRLLAFNAHDGKTRASIDVAVDGEHAGATVVEALEQLSTHLGGEVGQLAVIRDLGWESLESVLLAERCALYDPMRGGPHDRLAAMVHLGRAVGEAPLARYPGERLASIALDSTVSSAAGSKLASAAARALERAASDAPSNVDLADALAAVLLRLGRAEEAERRLNAAVVMAPSRARPYALLAQALRAQGKLDAALAALNAGVTAVGPDAALSVERGMVLSAGGDQEGAAEAWRDGLARDPSNALAFGRLSALALRTRDAVTAQSLIDSALSTPRAPADVFRTAVQLALGTEVEGLARASRLVRLCERWLERAPNDPTALLVFARSLLVLGERQEARARLDHLERIAPRSAAAAEAQMLRLCIDNPSADLEVQSALRAVNGAAPPDRLSDLAARARRLGTLHGAWLAWLAAGIAERKQDRWTAARGALEVGLEIAPGAPPLHLEMAGILLDLDDPQGALARVQTALSLGGPSPRAFAMLARALAASGRNAEALETAQSALAALPDDAELKMLCDSLQSASRGSRWMRQALRAVTALAKRK